MYTLDYTEHGGDQIVGERRRRRGERRRRRGGWDERRGERRRGEDKRRGEGRGPERRGGEKRRGGEYVSGSLEFRDVYQGQFSEGLNRLNSVNTLNN